MFLKWWKNRKVAASQDARRRGYKYASAHLLQGSKSIDELEIEAANAFDRNCFDAGVLAAVADYQSLLKQRGQILNQPLIAG